MTTTPTPAAAPSLEGLSLCFAMPPLSSSTSPTTKQSLAGVAGGLLISAGGLTAWVYLLWQLRLRLAAIRCIYHPHRTAEIIVNSSLDHPDDFRCYACTGYILDAKISLVRDSIISRQAC
eukprot:scaffold175066_cov29-Prasinocladus_malaysianus.AAC.1